MTAAINPGDTQPLAIECEKKHEDYSLLVKILAMLHKAGIQAEFVHMFCGGKIEFVITLPGFHLEEKHDTK